MHPACFRAPARLGGGLLALILTLAFTGCVRVEQTLKLNADGSGSLTMRQGIAEKDLAQMEALARAQLEEEGITNAAALNPFVFDEAEVRRDFEAYREEGVTLEDIRSETVDGWRYLQIQLGFASLEALGRTEFLSDRRIRLTRLKNGNYELVQESMMVEEPDPATADMTAEMMADFRAVLRVEVPGAVVETNADQQDGARVSWMFDLARDPRALERIRTMEFRVVFAGEGLKLPDYAGAGAAPP